MNFAFLAAHDPVLGAYASEAEALFRAHPRLCVTRLRTLAEALARHAAAYAGLYAGEREDFALLVGRLRDRGLVDGQVGELFRALRAPGDAAVHPVLPGGSPTRTPALQSFTHGDALCLLRLAWELGVWFHRSFRDAAFTPGPFVPPPDPAPASPSPGLAAEHAAFEAKLAAVQATAAAAPPAQAAVVLQAARAAAAAVDLDEAGTRALIDAQLREAGWEADSQALRYAGGARPTPGRNLAIAEWPTASGPADYALFAGLALVGIVEANKRAVDVMSALEQAARYARDVTFADTAEPAYHAPWGTGPLDWVPFLFATNGRPFVQQLRTRSGVWFRDLRRAANPAVPLVGWKTPEGLLAALRMDEDHAHALLDLEPTDYLGLRPRQVDAIRAVERAIQAGDRALLVAMGTGTGKTRTCIGLVYRLLKARRFRRVLFLVDRATLGDQAAQAFKDARLENFQSFADIYEVAELGDLRPGPDTRLHFATVQGMVHRLTTSDAGEDPLPVDTYDCIVVDESHRGPHLDRERSAAELGFRDTADYLSRCRRVLDHFDAVRIGLTATPALHTVELATRPPR